MADVVSSNIGKVIDAMRKAAEQVPFATALTLNRVDREVQTHEYGEQVPGKLTIRNQWSKPGMNFGINLERATKSKQEAVVFSCAPWLQLQEKGGEKKPKGTLLMAPVVGSPARPTQGSVVNKRLKPTKGGKIVFIPQLKGFFQIGKRPKKPREDADNLDFGALSRNTSTERPMVRLFSAFKQAFVKPRLESRKTG